MSNYTENHITEDQNHAWNKILKFIPNDCHVLDIGCSSGGLGWLLKTEKGCVVDGVEMDEKDASLAAKKLRKVWNSDIETAVTNVNDKYDVLIFADVLEHLMYPDKVLRAVKVLLKPSGIIVFSVPNMAHISVRLDLLSGNLKYTETGLLDKTHLHYWDIDTISDVFKRADMNLLELDSVTYRYPEKLIQKKLDDIGLKADRRGLDLLMSKEASAFQIVGFASIHNTKHGKIALPEPSLQRDISYMANYLTEHIKYMEYYIKQIEDKNSQLERQLKDTENSLYYKLTKGVRFFKSRFKKY
ncbi:MAG: class I SAM-dependent methyltransferase [Candidatus Saccharibacteria bacterium]